MSSNVLKKQKIVRKPITPGLRGRVDIALPKTVKPCKRLLVSKIRTNGRNNTGKITCRHRGGGHSRKIRVIDFKRNKDSINAKVETIEYDPNRNANIALICYLDGSRSYIIAPDKLNVGDLVCSGVDAPIKYGNVLPLRNIPLGTVICCIEMSPGRGAILARGAGAFVRLLAKDGDYAILKLPSGERRRFKLDCRAMVGRVSNEMHNIRTTGKAGAARWAGRRPTVRGTAMNPVDHPLGGGEGRTSGGRPRCSPTGVPNGVKTRRKKSNSDKYIIQRRK